MFSFLNIDDAIAYAQRKLNELEKEENKMLGSIRVKTLSQGEEMKTTGLTIQEAIKSGKRFRRPGSNDWYTEHSNGYSRDRLFSYAEILDNSWEIEVSKAQLIAEYISNNFVFRNIYHAASIEEIRKHLEQILKD